MKGLSLSLIGEEAENDKFFLEVLKLARLADWRVVSIGDRFVFKTPLFETSAISASVFKRAGTRAEFTSRLNIESETLFVERKGGLTLEI